MKIVSINKDVVVNLNKQFFVLEVLEGDKYVINDFTWNSKVLEGYEDVLIFKDTDIYYAEWVDANLVLHQVIDYDHLARYLHNLLPQQFGYFYLITNKFVLTLPTHLLMKLPLVDDPLLTKYHIIIN